MIIRLRPQRAIVTAAAVGMALAFVSTAVAHTSNTVDQPSERQSANETPSDATDREQTARDRERESQEREAREREARERERQARERDAASREQQDEKRDQSRDPNGPLTEAERRSDDAARERASRDAGHPSDPQVRVARRVLQEEARYRNRLARLARLRELATEQGNEERLRAIDNLEARLHEQHAAKIVRAREQLGDRFDRVKERLERGRGKRPAHAGPPGRERPSRSTAPNGEQATPPGRDNAGQAAPPGRGAPDTGNRGGGGSSRGAPDTGNRGRGGGNR